MVIDYFFMFAIIAKIILYILVITMPIILGRRYYYSHKERKKIEWIEAQKTTILHILVPKNNEKGPISAEQMFASLHGIFRTEEDWQQQISFEIISKNKYIHFYANVPNHLKDFIEGQIYAQYPDVEITEVEDYAHQDISGLKIAGAELLLNKKYFYPIKTFKNFEVDPLSAITSVLSKVKDNEEIWIQIIVRPVSDKWQDKGLDYIEAFRSGKSPEARPNLFFGILKGSFRFINDIISFAVGTTATTSEAANGEVKLSGFQQTALKGIEEKITKLGFETKIRLLVASADEYTASAKCSIVGGAFKQFNTINLNGFELSKISKNKEFLRDYQKRKFYDQGYVFNIEELASLFHLPNTSVETPSIVWAGSKKGEPPADLPVEESVKPEEITILGKSDFRHIIHRFGIKTKDRGLHMYAIGKTGTGKSTLLENMIIDDINKNRGVAVVDPHGELIDHILDSIPNSRINDVVYFNPADHDWPIGFNLLENVNPDLKNIVASGVVGIFKKIFESWGPRLEYILRNTILALLDYPNSTLLGITRLLVDKDYRKKVVEKIQDPVIRDFFINEYEKYDPKFRNEAIAPIQNKVGQFLSSSTIRNIIGQPVSTFNIEKLMNEGKILLINLSIGKIGEDNSALLGSMMITKIQLAAMSRANIAEKNRRDFYLYVDEFQNFATESFAVILSEARKYRLNLILTNQYIAQMPEDVAKAIFGNVGTLISFRVGSTDANFLVKEFEPVFDANDMVNLDNYHIYSKMAIDGVTRPAFSAITLPPTTSKIGNKDKIIKVSRERYSKPKAFVEEKIKEWSSETAPAREEIRIDQRIRELRQAPSEVKKEERKVEHNGAIYQLIKDKPGKNWYLPIEQKSEKVSSEPLLKKLEASGEKKKKESAHDGSVNSGREKDNNPVLKSILGPILAKRMSKQKQGEKGSESEEKSSPNTSSDNSKNKMEEKQIKPLKHGDVIKF